MNSSFKLRSGNKPSMAKLSGASPVLKRGCAPGSTDPGCPGNFKINRRGTKIGRFLSKSFRNLKYNVKSSIDKIKANRRKKNKTNFEKSSDGGSHKTPRYL